MFSKYTEIKEITSNTEIDKRPKQINIPTPVIIFCVPDILEKNKKHQNIDYNVYVKATIDSTRDVVLFQIVCWNLTSAIVLKLIKYNSLCKSK